MQAWDKQEETAVAAERRVPAGLAATLEQHSHPAASTVSTELAAAADAAGMVALGPPEAPAAMTSVMALVRGVRAATAERPVSAAWEVLRVGAALLAVQAATALVASAALAVRVVPAEQARPDWLRRHLAPQVGRELLALQAEPAELAGLRASEEPTVEAAPAVRAAQVARAALAVATLAAARVPEGRAGQADLLGPAALLATAQGWETAAASAAKAERAAKADRGPMPPRPPTTAARTAASADQADTADPAATAPTAPAVGAATAAKEAPEVPAVPAPPARPEAPELQAGAAGSAGPPGWVVKADPVGLTALVAPLGPVPL